MSDTDNTYALNQPTSPTSGYNSLQFAMKMASQARMTCAICKVMAVSTTGAVAAIGTVDVQPLVQMVDGIQRTTDHATIYGLQYFRMVGGKNAVIMDPQKGDLGFVVVADRDTTGVRQSMKAAPPGSMRQNNLADGIFISACLSEKPTSYVRWDKDNNIEITPDGGKTAVWVQPNRIDLGMKNAPHAVVTVDGPSTKVFAVISESGSQD